MYAVEYRSTMRHARDVVPSPPVAQKPILRQRVSSQTVELRQRARKLGVPEWVAAIIYAVAEFHRQSVADILSKTKVPEVVLARSEIMYRLYAKGHDHRRISTTRVGRWMNRDSSSVLHAIARFAKDTGRPALTKYSVDVRKRQMRAYWKSYTRKGRQNERSL